MAIITQPIRHIVGSYRPNTTTPIVTDWGTPGQTFARLLAVKGDENIIALHSRERDSAGTIADVDLTDLTAARCVLRATRDPAGVLYGIQTAYNQQGVAALEDLEEGKITFQLPVGAISFPVTGVNTGTKTFQIAGNYASQFADGDSMTIVDSTGNDGTYTVASASQAANVTSVVVDETISSAVADGNLVHSALQHATFTNGYTLAYLEISYDNDVRVPQTILPAFETWVLAELHASDSADAASALSDWAAQLDGIAPVSILVKNSSTTLASLGLPTTGGLVFDTNSNQLRLAVPNLSAGTPVGSDVLPFQDADDIGPGGSVASPRKAAWTAFPAMVGDSGSGGSRGHVPAPAAGDAAAGKYLKADGTWANPGGGGDATWTAVPANAPSGNGPGTIQNFVDWFANRCAAFGGGANWWTAPLFNLANAMLNAVASLASTGLIVRTGSGTATTRSVAATSNGGLAVTNGDGVAANPSLALSISNVSAAVTATASTDKVWLDNSGTIKSATLNLLTSRAFRALILDSPITWALDANENNYNPNSDVGLYPVAQIMPTTTNRTVTGLVAPAVSPMLLFVANVGTTYSLTLSHESGSSTAANRFWFDSAADLELAPGECIMLLYVNSRWRHPGRLAAGTGGDATILHDISDIVDLTSASTATLYTTPASTDTVVDKIKLLIRDTDTPGDEPTISIGTDADPELLVPNTTLSGEDVYIWDAAAVIAAGTAIKLYVYDPSGYTEQDCRVIIEGDLIAEEA